MTEERRAELETIHAKHIETGTATANSVVAMVQEYSQKLNPSEYWELLFRLGQGLEDLEHDASETADAYERSNYGVRLDDIDGSFDGPMGARDLRTPPTGLSG